MSISYVFCPELKFIYQLRVVLSLQAFSFMCHLLQYQKVRLRGSLTFQCHFFIFLLHTCYQLLYVSFLPSLLSISYNLYIVTQSYSLNIFPISYDFSNQFKCCQITHFRILKDSIFKPSITRFLDFLQTIFLTESTQQLL